MCAASKCRFQHVYQPNQWFQAKGTWWKVKDYFLFFASDALIFIISAVSWQRCEQSSLWVLSVVFGGQPQFRHRGPPVLPEAGVVSAGRQNKNRTLPLHVRTKSWMPGKAGHLSKGHIKLDAQVLEEVQFF